MRDADFVLQDLKRIQLKVFSHSHRSNSAVQTAERG